MLIVEGSDGVGKTVFCRKLLERLQREGPWIYAHFSKLPTTWAHPTSYFPRMSRYVVQDRFHMSDLAYRYARSEIQLLSPFAYSLVDARLRQLGGMTVVLTASEQTIRANHKGDGDMHPVDAHLLADAAFRDLTFSPMKSISAFQDYRVDWDTHWFGEDHGYPSDEFVDAVVEKYLRRMRELKTHSIRERYHG